MFAMFLPALLIISATWRLNDATSCTAATGNTCQKTRYVTGTCTSGLCTCIDGYESIRYGCIVKAKPVLTSQATDGGKPEVTSKGSGEVLTGGKIVLYCTTSRPGMTYVWSKDGVEVAGQVNLSLTLSSVSSSNGGQYRCKLKMDTSDYVSELSDPVTVKVVAANGNFAIQPVVTGMYKKAMVNSLITLECTNTPSGVGLTYEWFMDGATTGIKTATYNLTMTNQTLSKKVTCKIGQSSTVSGPTLGSPESAPVQTPSSLTDNISGATITDGQGNVDVTIWKEVGWDLTLSCVISDTDLARPTGLAAACRWTKDGTEILKGITYTKKAITTADAGVYQTFVSIGALPEIPSAPLTVVVLQPTEVLGKVSVSVVPSGNTSLEGGYMSIKCIAEVRNISRLMYLWGKYNDSTFISGQTDELIQINGVKSTDAGTYQCYVSTESRPGRMDTIMNAPVNIATVAPLVPTSDKAAQDSFGVGNTYTLTCTSIYDSPGVSYTWTEGSTVIAGATNKTYALKAKSGTNSYTCQIVLNTMASKSSPSLTVIAKNIIGVTISLADTTVSGTTIKPLNASKVTLECEATTAAGSSGAVTYAWFKNDQQLQNQAAATYEITAGADTDGVFKCSATVNSETATSDTVTVTAVATLEAPTVDVYNYTIFNGQQVYPAGGTFMLICRSASLTDSTFYAWWKNGTIIIGAMRRSHTISNAKQGKDGDSGVYTCKVLQGLRASVPSTGVTIAIADPGLPCKYATDCLGAQYGQNCTNNRCECASGYTPKGDTCSTSDVDHLRASALLLIAAALTRWVYQGLF